MAYSGKGEGTAASPAGGKSLSQLKTICKYYGWQDETTAGLAELTNFINHTLQMLCDLAPWPEYHRLDGVETFPAGSDDISAITGDGTTVTVTTSTSTGWSVGNILSIEDTDSYDCNNKALASISGTTITYLDSPTGAETSGTIKRYDAENLTNTNIIRIGTVQRTDRDRPLDEITMEDWLHNYRYSGASGNPTQYALEKYTSSGATKVDMYIYPKPTSSVTLYYTYQVAPTELSDNSDTTDWPNERIWLLSEGLRTRLARSDKDRAGMALFDKDFMAKVNRALTAARPSYMPIFGRAAPTIPAGKWSIRDLGRHNSTITS